MDEKSAMNVEFLRARLLSERIVSKTARQRAEMLSQRVIELEEQLRIVNIQRKKAEKAAEEVLSILETQGITCISGLTDSSTDQENHQLSDQEGNQRMISEDVKDDKFLTSSRMKRSELDDGLSCSDIDGSASDYNGLSWKSHGSTLDSKDKLKTKHNRHRQSSFIITVKSSQRRPGKSCRKIKRTDAGSASDNESQKPTHPDVHGNGVVAHPDDFDEKHECPLEISERKMDNFSVDSSFSFCPDGRNREGKDGGGKDDMERALEQQAQLIIQFQAMENAQKEWEEKFNETKMSILDNPEPDNQVIVVQNSNSSAEKSKLVGWIPHHEEEEKQSVKDISLTEDKNAGRCRNCEMADKKVASDKFSPGILSTLPPSPSKNGSNGHTNGSSNPMCESTSINVIKTVSKPFACLPQDGSDSAKKVRLGPNFTKSNTGSDVNLKVNPHDHGVPQYSSKEHRRHPSQADGLMEQQYDTMALNEANHATQLLTIPSQESHALVSSSKDLKGSIYEKSNAVLKRSSKMKFSQLTEKHTPVFDEKTPDKEMPEVKELPRQISRSASSSLGSVLQSLQQARISVRQELVKRPDSAQSTMTISSPANSPLKPNVSIDSSVLFRLPSDSFPQALSRPNIYGSGLRLTATHPDLGSTNTTVMTSDRYLNQSPSASYARPRSKISFRKDYGDQYAFSPYVDDVSGVQSRHVHANQYPAKFIESDSHVSTIKGYFDGRTSSSISALSAGGYPLYRPDLSTKRLSFHNEPAKTSSDLTISRKPYSNKYIYDRTAPSLT